MSDMYPPTAADYAQAAADKAATDAKSAISRIERIEKLLARGYVGDGSDAPELVGILREMRDKAALRKVKPATLNEFLKTVYEADDAALKPYTGDDDA